MIHPWGVAELYAALGEKEKAFDWLQRCIEQRQSWTPWMGVHPIFASLRQEVVHTSVRSNPRFRELLRQLNLPL